jgi:hypothetical protein
MMNKGGKMKKYLLNLLIIVGICIVACGNEPPEDFYEGTPEDIAAIDALLADVDNSILLVTEDMFEAAYDSLAMAAVAFISSDSFMRDDTFMVKHYLDQCATELVTRNDTLDYWFAKDTTCTVYVIDTFDVISLMHATVEYTAYYDSAIIDTATGDTVGWRIGTVDIDSTLYDDTSDLVGNGKKIIFFDYEDGNWELKRISYGEYNFPAYSTEIPDINTIILTRENGDADTIIASSTDTLITDTTGQHVMDRFRAIDSLLEYDAGETLFVEITLRAGATVAVGDCELFASCGGARVNLGYTAGRLGLTGQGITNLCFEAVLNETYYYVLPQKEYKAQVWLIPVNIGGTQ